MEVGLRPGAERGASNAVYWMSASDIITRRLIGRESLKVRSRVP